MKDGALDFCGSLRSEPFAATELLIVKSLFRIVRQAVMVFGNKKKTLQNCFCKVNFIIQLAFRVKKRSAFSQIKAYFLGFLIAACAAASLAIGTLNGEQDT